MRSTASVLALIAIAAGCGGQTRERAPLPEPRPGTVVVLVGDIACSPSEDTSEDRCRHAATARLVEALKPDRVLPLGDLQYERGRLEDFRLSYDRTWGRFKRITRPVPGNHEYQTPGAAGYFEYFGPAAGARGEGWYSWDLAGWHFVALNSNCDEVDCQAGSPQERWLRGDLAATDARCVLAYTHHPRFSSGMHGPYEGLVPIWTALQDAGADLVVSGHDHNYERFAALNESGREDPQRGIPSFVVGTGGKSLREMAERFRGSQLFSHEAYGVLELRLRPDGYDWRFVAEPGEEFEDHGSGECR